MRHIRRFATLTALAMTAAAGIALATNANAQTTINTLSPTDVTPTAPYNAITTDSVVHNGVGRFDIAYATPNQTLSVAPYGTGFTLTGTNGSTTVTARVQPMTGTPLTAGVFPVALDPDANHVGLAVSTVGSYCTAYTGTITVTDVTMDAGTGLPTTFTATYQEYCNTPTVPGYGELRWNSAQGFVAAARNGTSVGFGVVNVGGVSASKSFIVTGTGSIPVQFGAAAMTGSDPTQFAIITDSCSHQSLAFGQQCTVTVSAEPTTATTVRANLTIPDNTAVGLRNFAMSATGNDKPAITVDPTTIDLGSVANGAATATQTVTVHSTGVLPLALGMAGIGGDHASSFVITDDHCSNTTLAVGDSCTIGVYARPKVGGVSYVSLGIPSNAYQPVVYVALSVTGQTPAMGTYYPITSTRLLDTRNGTGRPAGTIGPGQTIDLTIDGANGLPASGIGAVVLNVTVTNPTAKTFIKAFPTGATPTDTSNLNVAPGWTGANSVTVKVGAGGKVSFYNNAGSTNLIVDATGFYAGNDDVLPALGVGGQFQLARPIRLVDTRLKRPVGPSGVLEVGIAFGGPVDQHVRALVVNITAVRPQARGFLAAYDGYSAQPTTSTLNFTAGATVSNFAIVPSTTIGPNHWIGVVNNSVGQTDILVDIIGFIDDSTVEGGLRYRPLDPTRIVDSRIGLGLPGALGAGKTGVVTPAASTIGGQAVAVGLNVTAVAPTANTYLTLWPTGSGFARPTVSTLDPARGVTLAGAAIAGIGPTGGFNLFNYAGTTNVVLDVNGVYEPGLVAGSGEIKTGTGLKATQPRATPWTVISVLSQIVPG